MSGWSCVEEPVVSVRSVVCAHFVSDIFLQILAVSFADLGNFLHYFNRRARAVFATFGSKVGGNNMEKHRK